MNPTTSIQLKLTQFYLIVFFSPSLRINSFADVVCVSVPLFCSVKTDLMENGANSTLFIAKVRKTDTGNYTCSIGQNDFYTINVHILSGNLFMLYEFSRILFETIENLKKKTTNPSPIFVYLSLCACVRLCYVGESLAELYHGSAVSSLHHSKQRNWINLLFASIVLLLASTFNCVKSLHFVDLTADR